MWVNPVEIAPLLWDASMCEDTSKGIAIRELIAKACVSPLSTTQADVSASGLPHGSGVRDACACL
jgi:hypothetical protein